MTCEFFDGHKWQMFCNLPLDISPLSAVVFPMIPNVEEYIPRMYLVPEPSNAPSEYSRQSPAVGPVWPNVVISDDSGLESDNESGRND